MDQAKLGFTGTGLSGYIITSVNLVLPEPDSPVTGYPVHPYRYSLKAPLLLKKLDILKITSFRLGEGFRCELGLLPLTQNGVFSVKLQIVPLYSFNPKFESCGYVNMHP